MNNGSSGKFACLSLRVASARLGGSGFSGGRRHAISLKRGLWLAITAAALCSHLTLAQSPQYQWTDFASIPGGPGNIDGTGANARFDFPQAAAVDSAGNVYVADTVNSAIRKVTPAGVVTTFAGAVGQSSSTDAPSGPATSARFNSPAGIAIDSSGNLYVADTGNQTIRKITPSGAVTTVAGAAGQPGSADGASITTARFFSPTGIAVDTSGNIYVADAFTNIIRKISSGTVTTVAGAANLSGSTDAPSGPATSARFNGPHGIAIDNTGNIYVADYTNATIRKITAAGAVTTLAGSPGQFGSADGTGSFARFTLPQGVAVDASGNVFVADTINSTIRKITSTGSVSTIAGTAPIFGGVDAPSGPATSARFYNPAGLALDASGNIYVADTKNNAIRKLTQSGSGTVTTMAGALITLGSADAPSGPATVARFASPTGIAADASGNLYVADSSNNTIRKITPAGVVSTIAGAAGQPSGSTDAPSGPATSARFSGPQGIAIDSSGNIFVADTLNSTIRKITPSGSVTTIAGAATVTGSTDAPSGPGTSARFYFPYALAVDGSGNVYVADTYNETIRKLTTSGSVTTVTTLAGSAGIPGAVDSPSGPGSAARFTLPCGIAVDSSQNVYVGDTSNQIIRKITSAGVVTTVAGQAATTGGADAPSGPATAARFNGPWGLTFDSIGVLYIVDHTNNTIRKMSTSGSVSTIGGTALIEGGADGAGAAAQFASPIGIAVNSSGALFVADFSNNRISRGILGTGSVNFASGSTTPITSNGYTAAGATLGAVTLGFSPTPGQVLTLVNNTSSNPISGVFTGLPQGATVSASYGATNYNFTISYTGGSGHNITLTAQTLVPAFAPWGYATLGALFACVACWQLLPRKAIGVQ